MITNDLNLLSVPPARGDYGVVDPLNAWPGAGPVVTIYMATGPVGQIIQTGFNVGEAHIQWQRYRDAFANVWTPWERVSAGIIPDIYVELAGDQMTGPLLLARDPSELLEAASKNYVDQAVGDIPMGTYRGEWQVAANVPDLTLVTKVNGDTWRAVTVNPLFPEVAPAGIPGIGGMTITDGDGITWNSGAGSYVLIPNLALTVPEGDARYINVVGDAMTGPLFLEPAAPTLPLHAASKEYVDIAVATGSGYQGVWQVAANVPDLIAEIPTNGNGYFWSAETADPLVAEVAPAGIPGIAGLTINNGDTIVWNAGTSQYDHILSGGLTVQQGDARYLRLIGGLMAGTINMDANFITGLPTPLNPDHASTKAYTDTKLPVVPVTGTPTLGTAIFHGQYYPVAPYVPADAPVGATGVWAMAVERTGLGVWQLFLNGPGQWSRYSANAGGAWTPWAEIGAAGGPFLPLAGGTMTGPINMGGDNIRSLATPILPSDAVNRQYADTKLPVIAAAVNRQLGTMVQRGDYHPDTPYIPADAPAGATDHWIMESRSSLLEVWQVFASGLSHWSRYSVNGGGAWSPWQSGSGGAFLPLAGGTMTGPLVLMPGAPLLDDLAATSKAYVDQAVAAGGLYQGTWEVAANTPDLIAEAATAGNGFYWVAITVDPLVPEVAPAGIPGIAGETIANGDGITWNTALARYDHVAAGGITEAEADARYLQLAGGAMTGPIAMGGQLITGLADPTAGTDAANRDYADTKVPVVGLGANVDLDMLRTVGVFAPAVLGQIPTNGPPGLTNTGWSVTVTIGDTRTWQVLTNEGNEWFRYSTNNGASWPNPWVQTIGAGTGGTYLELSGGTMTGPIVLEALAPQADRDAVPKAYVDNLVNPLQWEQVLSLPVAGGSTGGAGQTNYMYRNRFETAMFQASGGGKVRVTFAGQSWDFEAFIGYAAPSPGAGDLSDFESPPTRLTFGGSNIGTFAPTPANNAVVSDPVDFFVDPAKPLLVSIKVLAGGGTLASVDDVAGRHRGWYQPNGIVDQVDAPPMDAFATDTFGMSRIEQGQGVAAYLPISGGAMTGPIDMGGQTISNVPLPLAGDHAASKTYVDNTGFKIFTPAAGTSFNTFTTPGLYIINYNGAGGPTSFVRSCVWVSHVGNNTFQHAEGINASGNPEYYRRIFDGFAWRVWSQMPTFTMDELDARYIQRSGDIMEGPLLLPVMVPTGPRNAAISRDYVDLGISQALASLSLYRGSWSVATNSPNIATATKVNGYSWRAVTVDPLVPETPPAGIPGLSGKTIRDGSLVVWSEVNQVFDIFPLTGLTVPEADGRYLQLAGGTLTGSLTLPAATPTGANQAVHKTYADTHLTKAEGDAAYLSQSEGDAAYLSQGEGDGRYLRLSGGTVSGNIVMTAGAYLSLGSTVDPRGSIFVYSGHIDMGDHKLSGNQNAARPEWWINDNDALVATKIDALTVKIDELTLKLAELEAGK